MAKTVRKGRIGLGDIQMTPGNFTRSTSAGGTQTLSPFPQVVVDPNGQYTTIQAAVNAANALSPKGAVLIPSTYGGTDSYTNAGLVTVLDLRGSGTLGALRVWQEISTARNVKDAGGVLLPLGNDLVLSTYGAADNQIRSMSTSTTATTSVAAPGTQNITVGSTANFYEGASIFVHRWNAAEEEIVAANWSIVDATTINATFANAHTQPYTVDQWGSINLRGWLLTFHDEDTANVLWQFKQRRTGAARWWEFLGSPSSNVFPMFSKEDDLVPRYYGRGGTGVIFYASDAGTGTDGSFFFRNNRTDDTFRAKIDSSGLTIPSVISDGANPSSTGTIRLTTSNTIAWRNAANTADLPLAITNDALSFRRYRASGTALVAGDFALSAGWGDTASVGSIRGTDQFHELTITSAGTGQGANPTLTLTYKDGTWTTAPVVRVNRQEFANQATVTFTVTTQSATQYILTFNGTPVAAETYRVCVFVGGI